MSKHDQEHDEHLGDGHSLEDQLWGAEGDSASELHGPDEPGFDNREARDTLSESLDDPTDAIPKDRVEEPAAKKSSSLPFYGAVGTFALLVVGLVGYKTGLIGGSHRKPIEPASVAAAMAREASKEAPKKADSMAAAVDTGRSGSPDLLGGGDSKARSTFDAEADLLSEKASGPAAAAPGPVLQEAPKPEAPAPAAVVSPPPAAGPVALVEKPVPAAAPVQVAKTAPAPEVAPKVTPRDKGEGGAAPANGAPETHVKPARVAVAHKATAPAAAAKVASAPRSAAAQHVQPVRVAHAHKPPKGKGAGKIDKDATPESKEVLAGWKLRGTWPNHGPSQLAWVADESGRLTTVSVGTRIAGARVVSIGNRGEVVQTTAGQILP